MNSNNGINHEQPSKKQTIVDGILLLDKPEGITSNRALTLIKKLFQIKSKVGHSGSLDPLATGVLPVVLGEATKFSSFLLNSDKSYQVTAKLGEKTTTGDSEGEVIKTKPNFSFTQDEIENALQGFLGKQMQTPSMFSAIKHKGQPLYKLARKGVEVERKAREINIYSVELLDFTGDSLSISVKCSKGTYIRSLIDDLGESLGCYAHVTALRRTQVAHFSIEDAITIEQLTAEKEANGLSALAKLCLPADSFIDYVPKITLANNSAYYLSRGQAVLVPKAPTSGYVRLYTENSFIGLGVILDDGRVAPKRLLSLVTASVS